MFYSWVNIERVGTRQHRTCWTWLSGWTEYPMGYTLHVVTTWPRADTNEHIVFHCETRGFAHKRVAREISMLAKVCSKPSKPGFSSMGTNNFQIHKLGFKEAEQNCQQSVDHGESETARRNNLKYADTTLPLGTKKPLDESERRVKKLA